MEFVIILLVLLFLVGYYVFSTMQDMKVKRAEKAVRDGDLETALSIFMNSLKKDPEDIDSIWHIGNINEERGQYPEAIGYYTKLLEIGKESKLFTLFELYRRVGLLYHKIDRDQEALDYLFQAYNIIQSARDVLEEIAMIIYSQKSFHRALPFFEKAVQFNKGKGDLLKHYGLCMVLSGRAAEAVNALEDASRLAPDYETRFILAYVYYRMGAFQKSREMIEELVNGDKVPQNKDMLYYAVKLLFLLYLKEKNYEICRDLIQQMKNIQPLLGNENLKEEISMAYIFFRVKQGYFDVAMEEIAKKIPITPSANMSDDQQKQMRENKSHLYELVSSLDRFKKEKDKAMYTGTKSRMDAEFVMMENKANDSQKELDKLFIDWQDKFVTADPLWDFFGIKSRAKFDPTLIIEKYAEDSLQTLKSKRPEQAEKEQEGTPDQLAQSEAPCELIMSCDFPTFMRYARQIAENMGFRIINQAVKIDPMSYAEGQSIDFLCEEKYKKDNRILFCFRRWKEEIGYISLMTILGAVKTQQANRLVLISLSPLSLEANRAVEGNSSIDFHLCEDVAHYLG